MLPVVRALAFLALLLLVGCKPSRPSDEQNNRLLCEEEYHRVFRQLLAKTVRTHFSRYMLSIGHPLQSFQPELWAYFLEFVDGKSLWEMSLTCKWFGALIRNEDLGIYNKWHDRNVISVILMDSELALPDSCWELVKYIVDYFLPPKTEEEMELLDRSQIQFRTSFVHVLLRKNIGPLIGMKVVKQARTIPEEYFFKLLDTQYIFRGPKLELVKTYYYLPLSTGEKRLFDHVNSTTMNLLMSSGPQGQPHLFSLAILVDYVIPALHKRRAMTIAERQALDEVYPLLCSGLVEVVDLLLWAFHLGHKSLDNENQRMRTQLKALGIKWTDIRLGCYRAKDFLRMKSLDAIPDMKSIMLMAKYFGLSYNVIARQTTSISELSQQIINGDIPDYLSNTELPTSMDLFKVLYGKEPAQYQQPKRLVDLTIPEKTEILYEKAPAQYQQPERLVDLTIPEKTEKQDIVEPPLKKRRLADCPPTNKVVSHNGPRNNTNQPVYQRTHHNVYIPAPEYVQYPFQEQYGYHKNRAPQNYATGELKTQNGTQEHDLKQHQVQEQPAPQGQSNLFSAVPTEKSENFIQSFPDVFEVIDPVQESHSDETLPNEYEFQEYYIEINEVDRASTSEPYFDSNMQNIFDDQFNTTSQTAINSIYDTEPNDDYWA